MLQRRAVILGLTGLLASPAIVRANTLMRLSPQIHDGDIIKLEFMPPLRGDHIADDVFDNYQRVLLEFADGWQEIHRGRNMKLAVQEMSRQLTGNTTRTVNIYFG